MNPTRSSRTALRHTNADADGTARSRRGRLLVGIGTAMVFLPAITACGSDTATIAVPTTAAPSNPAPNATSATAATTVTTTASTTTAADPTKALATALKSAKWASGVTITVGDGYITYASNGIPNHTRPAKYALPNDGVMIPSAATAHAAADPTVAQTYSFKIPTTPKKASSPASTSLGTIGFMISGAGLFNPYEGDGSTVAMASNFTVNDSDGKAWAFLDSCNGHPTPRGEYHYHALPACVTSQVDTLGGPSHIIGVAFDGYPIYGDRDLAGKRISASQLDKCGGTTSPTPEFPNGTYHYVLLQATDATSSIRCFTGTVDASLTSMHGMPPHP